MDMSNTATSEQFLTQVNRLIDWEPFTSLTRAISARVHAEVPLPAVKMLLLAHWYGMNEVSLIEAFQDRISFRRFLGLGLNNFHDDIRLGDAFRRIVAQAPMETQTLIHSIETQLRAKGFTIKAGMWAEATVVPTPQDSTSANMGACNTVAFRPGEMARLREDGDSVVARGGAQVAGKPPPMTESITLQPPAERALALVQGVIEWPWGATTELKEHFNIGRDFDFCPFARELQSYRLVSRKHAELAACGDGIWVHDLHSRNGTFVTDTEVPKGQAFLVDSDASLRCGPNLVILLNLKQ